MSDRTERLIFLARSLVRAFGGSAKKEPTELSKVVIFQLAKMGDMVCTTPVFRAIKEKYPSVSLLVVGDKINKELLAGHPCVDEYVVWEEKNLKQIISRLKKENIDFGCTTGPSFEALAVMFLAGVKTIVCPKVENGWSPYETKPYRILRKFAITKPHRMGSYAPREYLRLLEPLGIRTDDTNKSLIYSDKAKSKIDTFLSEHNLSGKKVIGLAPGAGNRVKLWPTESFAALADYLITKRQTKVILVGGQNDIGLGSELLSKIDNNSEVIIHLWEQNPRLQAVL